jgi:hypothetical protein
VPGTHLSAAIRARISAIALLGGGGGFFGGHLRLRMS